MPNEKMNTVSWKQFMPGEHGVYLPCDDEVSELLLEAFEQHGISREHVVAAKIGKSHQQRGHRMIACLCTDEGLRQLLSRLNDDQCVIINGRRYNGARGALSRLSTSS